MRVYFCNKDKVIDNLENGCRLGDTYNNLINKTNVTKIFSIEGIFYVYNNTLNRVIINDLPVEKVLINNVDLLIDKSSIVYEPGWVQLNPNHVVESVTVYTYCANEIGPNEIGPNDKNVKFVIEKKNNIINDVYFEVEDIDLSEDIDKYNAIKKDIVTFLL